MPAIITSSTGPGPTTMSEMKTRTMRGPYGAQCAPPSVDFQTVSPTANTTAGFVGLRARKRMLPPSGPLTTHAGGAAEAFAAHART